MPKDIDPENQVIRFNELDTMESPFQPADMALERFARHRYSVVGRPAEKTAAGKGTGAVKDFSVVYISCEPGKGIGAHAHSNAEVFIPMSGRWRVTMHGETEQAVELGPWDVISVPPDVMHGAENIGEDEAWLLAINAGGGTAKSHWHPELIAEILAAGGKV
ncbi:MAG: cupin domain-containing protein [Proteobacteria bacterium]|nr:cupin domain-containing protein [Pseudomonadota bacterium]